MELQYRVGSTGADREMNPWSAEVWWDLLHAGLDVELVNRERRPWKRGEMAVE